ncbi:MAG: ABC transporter substrate-binding protein [Alphaproteobacteria bacterium]|nr:ABC transporter substrate-binding protein [Alphaproteobacteria bacterium]
MTARILALAAGLALAAAPALAQKVVRIVPHADLKVVDGHQTTATITGQHMAAVYDSLFNWDEKLDAKPQMVETYTLSPDKLTYTFTLRPGLKFHDGSPVTTKDVVASVKRMLARELLGRSLNEFVASVQAVDDKTFRLTMKEPFGPTLYTLGGNNSVYGGIYREKEALIDPNTPITESIGSGPFKFVKEEWVPGAKIVYAKNADYVPRAERPSGVAGGKVVKVDRIEYKVIPDPATAFAALNSGEVDILDQPSLDLINLVEKNPDVALGEVQLLPAYGGLRPNFLHPPFNNVKARQALALMVDQRTYAQAAYGEERWWKVCFGMYMCRGPFATEVGSDAYRKQDIDKAKQLLKEAGYNGEPIVLIGASDLPALNALTLVTAENLKKIGMNVDLKLSDWGSVVTRRSKKEAPADGGWHIFHTTFGGATGASPLTSLPTVTTCDKSWFGWACDQQAEDIRQKFLRETDSEKQKELVDALHKRLWEVLPFIPLAEYVQPWPHRKSITGLLKAPLFVYWSLEKS